MSGVAHDQLNFAELDGMDTGIGDVAEKTVDDGAVDGRMGV